MNALVIIQQAGFPALPDNDQWTHRFEIRSESSSRNYIIAKRKTSGEWGCSCMGWKRFRHCKHLRTVDRVTNQIDAIDGVKAKPSASPATASANAVAVQSGVSRSGPKSAKAIENARLRTQHSFSDAAYKHYDTSNGFGSPEEWARMAEELLGKVSDNPEDARVRGKRRPAGGKRGGWLAAIGLVDAPASLRDLKSAARKRMMETHPDRGGTADAFREVFDAYKSLALDIFGVEV